MTDQLPLFPSGASEATAPERGDLDALGERFARLAALAARLPACLFMGTSSWSFPGWRGIVYGSRGNATTLARNGLREYVRHPLLRTVGIDRGYYAPIPGADLRSYAEQLPPGFRCCTKAPAGVTSPVLPAGNRREPNPDYLSAERFVGEMLEPFGRWFADHAGPFILQFPPVARGPHRDPAAFAEGLDRFLEPLPREFQYAVEVRERSWLTDAYFAVLARHGAAHVYNYWSRMPRPGAQAELVPPDIAPFALVRLLMPPGAGYEQQREAFRPFDRLASPDEAMRDDVARIVQRAATRRRPVFVLANNKAEGSAPLTIEALAERIAGAMA
jgi:uncharacterized protein YecE (DUF72 family)